MKNKYHCARHHHRIHLIHFHCVRRVWSASFCIGWYVVVENTNLFSQWEKWNDECRQEIESDTPFNVIPPNSQSFIINIYLNTTQQNTRERHTSAAATARTQSNEKTTKSFSRDISDFSTNCFYIMWYLMSRMRGSQHPKCTHILQCDFVELIVNED